MDKAEAKYANTAKKMDNAMLALLEEKPFDSISVTDVCKAAHVHRSTFYSHYENTRDLLNEVKDTVMADFFANFDHLSRDDGFLTLEYLDAYLSFVEKNKLVFKVFLENLNLFDGYAILLGFEDDMHQMSPGRNNRDKRIARYKLIYLATGVTSIVSYWLEGGCEESRKELINIILECAAITDA